MFLIHQNIYCKFSLFVTIYLFLIVFWNEYLLYYIYLWSFCHWPTYSTIAGQMNVFVLSDTHMLGAIRGHWLDKLRREWQMYRSFQSAVDIFSPDTAFILGDIFDEGQWATKIDFHSDVQRYRSIFYLPNNRTTYVVAGNHDIGFHYWTNNFLNQRFNRKMNTTSADLLILLNNIYIVRINSIAMENDGCSLCIDAEKRLERIANQLEKLRISTNKPIYPIILTHFPLYRQNENICEDKDMIISNELVENYRQGYDCFSKEASNYILKRLKPRLILNGHVHHSCRVNHSISLSENLTNVIDEITVASFNWRNKVNPSFLLLQINETSHLISRCYLPNENVVFATYLVSISILVLLVLCICVKIKRKAD